MARPARTIEGLRGSSEHLYYEISMLDAAAPALASGIFGPGPATNAFLESFTVHVRALMQFFYPNSPKSDDVLLHYGKGQLEAELALSPGTHTLCLQAADGVHIALAGVGMTQEIILTVK